MVERERTTPVVEQRGLEPVVEQRAKRAISRDHPNAVDRLTRFRDRTSSFLNQRHVPAVEQRRTTPVVEQRAKRAISRDHHQDAISRDHPNAVDRLTGFRDRTSSFLNQRHVPAVEQRTHHAGGRAARCRAGGRAATHQPDGPSGEASSRPDHQDATVETTPTRSIASPGFETGLRPSSTSGTATGWSSSEADGSSSDLDWWSSTRPTSSDAIESRPPPRRDRSRPLRPRTSGRQRGPGRLAASSQDRVVPT